MKSSSRKIANRQPARLRVGALACAMLGFFWAASPVFHGCFHLAEISHRHPSGSVHQHADIHQHPHAEEHHHAHADGARHESHSHESRDREQPSEQREQSHNPPQRPDPQPIPPDDNSPIVFFTLELAASHAVSIDVELSEASPLVEKVFESAGFDHATIIGAASPRGPPA